MIRTDDLHPNDGEQSMRTDNPKLFREMSEPFNGAEEANVAVQAFCDDVKAAREKHRIANVVVGLSVNVIYENGEEGIGGSSMNMGDLMQAQLIAATLLGQYQAECRQAVTTAISRASMSRGD